MYLRETETEKFIRSPGYNYNFNKKTGMFIRWGETVDDDPDFSPFGPEIADIEVTTICSGPAGKPCSFCYKGNTPRGTNMTFETFVKVFNNLPSTVTQIAFGADAGLTANPDIWRMFDFCRANGVIPNVTVANIDDETAKRLAAVCGGVAVSRYYNKNWCYDSVQRLVNAGMNQVNIHQMLSEETYNFALETIEDRLTDDRLDGLHAIVFLSLKQVGRGVNNKRLSFEKFKHVIDTAMEKRVNFGMDSCSATKFIEAIRGHEHFDKINKAVEPCEALSMSMYANVEGKLFPCSFTEEHAWNDHDWTNGIDLTKPLDFVQDVWYDDRVTKFRCENTSCGRKCIAFDI